jgi:hypothetical protein
MTSTARCPQAASILALRWRCGYDAHRFFQAQIE